MRRFALISVLAFFLWSSTSDAKGTLTAYLSCATFNTSSGQPYFETYLTVIGETTAFLKDSAGRYKSRINVDISFFKGDSVIKSSTYNLSSPEIKDTLKKPDFIDVQRYWLPQGIYTMQITMKDLGDAKTKPLSVKQKINVGFSPDSISISDVEFLESYSASAEQSLMTKNGFNLVPYVYNYYPEEIKEMKFYAETYNANKVAGEHEKFVLRYFIEDADTKAKLSDFNSVSVLQADTVNIILGGFSLENLPSGNYALEIQVVDKNNNVKASRSFNFIRHNPHTELGMRNLTAIKIANTFVARMNDKDSLIEDIHSLWPIAHINERDFSDDKNLEQKDITLLKQFFYNFWKGRNADDPAGEWNKYHAAVIAVNTKFATLGMKGYQTDRGRVYLQYGAPNQRVTSDLNPDYYPYEIWEYYKLPDGETDKKFVFYEPGIGTNNYVLLHSSANNEVHERRWQVILNSRNGMPYDIDQNSVRDPFGENALDEFSNPR